MKRTNLYRERERSIDKKLFVRQKKRKEKKVRVRVTKTIYNLFNYYYR